MPRDAASVHDVRDRVESLERLLYALRQELAGATGIEERPRGPFEYLACRLGGVELGLRLDHVEEVVPIARLAALPEAPAWVSGLLNLRGESLPVIDGLARIERRPRAPELSDLVVVCSLRERRFGLVVQEVLEVRSADGSQVASAGEVPHAPYLVGVVESGDRSVQLMSLERLLHLSDVPEVAS